MTLTLLAPAVAAERADVILEQAVKVAIRNLRDDKPITARFVLDGAVLCASDILDGAAC